MQTLPIMVARMFRINQWKSEWSVRTYVLRVTFCKNSKIGTAELIKESEICSTSVDDDRHNQSSIAVDMPLLLLDNILAAQKEQLFFWPCCPRILILLLKTLMTWVTQQ